MGTLGKALGASGGYICGSRALIDFLVNRARSFIFSTAPVPAAAAAATAGIQLVQSVEGKTRCEQLWQRVAECRTGVAPVSISLPLSRNQRWRQARRLSYIEAPSFRSSSAMKPRPSPPRRSSARTRLLRSRHPLSDRRARRGAPAHHAHRRSLRAESMPGNARASRISHQTRRIANRKSEQMHHARPTRPRPRLASVHPDARLAQARADRHHVRQRRGAARRSRQGVSRRQLLHLDQPARPSASEDQRGHRAAVEEDRAQFGAGTGE